MMGASSRLLRQWFAILLLGIALWPSTVIAAAYVESRAGYHYADPDVDAFWGIVERMDRQLTHIHAKHTGMVDDVTAILTPLCSEIVPKSAEGRAFRVEAKERANNPGVDFDAGISDGIDVTTYNVMTRGSQNAYVGLRWDLLRSGWRENKQKSELLDIQANEADLQARIDYENRLNQCRADKVEQGFLPLEARLLQLKVELLRSLWRLQMKTYLSGNSFFENALAIEQELQVASQDLAELQPALAESPNAKASDVGSPPILDVLMPPLLASIAHDTKLAHLAELEKERVSREKVTQERARLQLGVRYEFRKQGFATQGPSGYVRYTQPLFEHSQAGLHEREQAIDQRTSGLIEQRKRDAQQAHKQFNAARQRTLRQWYRYQRAMERLRRSIKNKELDPTRVNGALAAQRAVEAIDAALDLTRSKIDLYRRTDDIFSRAKLLYDAKFIRVGTVVESNYRGRTGVRSLYLWSRTFQLHSNTFFMTFLQAKAIRAVMLSAAQQMDARKRDAFIAEARDAHIHVSLLFSDNRWLEPENYKRALDRINTIAKIDRYVAPPKLGDINQAHRLKLSMQSLGGKPIKLGQAEQRAKRSALHIGMGAIHLDIEPHMVPKYKQDRARAQRAYVAMLRYLRRHLNRNLQIDVSLPAHLKRRDYAEIAKLADHLFIMDYGSSDPDRILRRLQAARDAIPLSKLTLALRVSDFASERELEKSIDIIAHRTGLRHFAIHAARDYIQLTNRFETVQTEVLQMRGARR